MAYNPQPPLGQAAMAASLPVAIASDQTAIKVNVTDLTTGGYSATTVYAAATTNLGYIASSAKVMGWYVYNNFTTPIKLCFYDVNGVAPVATATPKFVIVIPATSGANVSFPNGIQFTNNIGYGTSSTLALGSPTPTLTALTTADNFIFTIFYK